MKVPLTIRTLQKRGKKVDQWIRCEGETKGLGLRCYEFAAALTSGTILDPKRIGREI